MKKVSVIIPVTRKILAQKAERSVRTQGYSQVEVIKIDARGLTPAQARNKGAKKAKGEVLLFLDDDCQARNNWLVENLRILADPKIGAVGGMIQGKSKKYFSRCLDFANFTFVQGKKRRFMLLYTASLGIKAEVFEKAGGFDESLVIGEDVDLCFRLNRLGLKTVYEPEIKVWHHHQKKTLKDLLKYQYQNGRVKGLSMEKNYPDNLWFAFLKIISRPWIYWFFVLPFAVLATLVAVGANWKDRPEVFYLIPGIFLAKLACQVGTLANTIYHRGDRLSYLTLFVTGQCNLYCQHCFYWKNLKKPARDWSASGRKKELTLAEIEQLSQNLNYLNLLLISGGEPFLRSDLNKIVKIFVENNQLKSVSVTTNGFLPERIEKKVEKILQISDYLLVIICLSVDGTEKIHDQIRGVKGSFKKVVETYKRLRILKKRYKNLRIRLNATVFSLNYKNLFKLVDQVPELFPDNYLLSLSLLRGQPRKKNLKLPSIRELKELFHYKNKKLKGKRSWLSRLMERIIFWIQIKTLKQKKQLIPCQAGKLMAVVLEDGRLAPCELLPLVGNIRKRSFKEIWQGKKMKQAREKITKGECFCTQEGVLYLSLISQPLVLLSLIREALWLKRN